MSDTMSVVNKVCLRESAYKLPLCLRFHLEKEQYYDKDSATESIGSCGIWLY